MLELIAMVVLADVRYVDSNSRAGGNGTSWSLAYDSVQEAFDDPHASEIRIADGTYVCANLELGNRRVVGGFGGETILDAQESGRMFEISGSSSLEHLNIHNTVDSALWMPNGGTLSVTTCAFENCQTNSSGGTIRAQDACVSFDNCTFTDGFANGSGGCISASDSIVKIHACAFSASATFGGSISIGGGSLDVESCSFSNGLAEGGGAIGAWSAQVTIADSYFVGNTATFFDAGGALLFYGDTDAKVEHCSFAHNSCIQYAIGRGSAIQASDNASVLVMSGRFYGNTTPELHTLDSATITVQP